ncbi:hypothetical protein F5Y10DRAFT_253229 [Nemania abortiva]|nr:hypothetical protein F5Y10DRAFT_253229 [Nemania abortiva]
MYTTKVFLSIGSLAAVSLAQSFPSDPSCQSSLADLGAAAPSIPPAVAAIMPDSANILKDPAGYASTLCSIAAELPASELSEFGAYGQSLLHFASVEISSYDALVTKCFATGAEATSATNYIHSIVSQTAPLCQETGVSSGGNGPSNGTATITAAPTSTPISTLTARTNSTTSATTLLIPTAAAVRPAGVFAGAAGVAGILAAALL